MNHFQAFPSFSSTLHHVRTGVILEDCNETNITALTHKLSMTAERQTSQVYVLFLYIYFVNHLSSPFGPCFFCLVYYFCCGSF